MTTRSVLAFLTALSLGVGSLRAQSAPVGSTARPTPDATAADGSTDASADDVITLDPFTVRTDQEGYQAVDTLAGGRVRTSLKDTSSALSVVTVKFLQDLGINNAQDLLIYTNNTEVAGLNGNFSGLSTRGFGVTGAAEQSRLVNPAGVNRARGLTAMDSTRNYFLSEIPWDGFNISRVDISRGPNSFLFGVGSPSGISNVSTNDALFKDKGSFESHYGSYGTTREALDYNKVLIDKQLAFRIDLVNDETRYQQEPAYNHTKRAYGAVRFDPKIFDTPSSHMKITLNYEVGRGDSNNPRVLPPMDYISSYFQAGVNHGGYDPFAYVAGPTGSDPAATPWVSNGDIHYAWGSSPTYRFDGVTGTLLSSQQGLGGLKDAVNSIGGFSGVSNVYNLYTTGFNHYAQTIDATWNPANGPSPYPGAYAGTISYMDKTLSDPSIFDFYNKLIDGPNKHEWQSWNAFNLSVVQSLFHDRLVLQGVIEHEDYSRGQEGLMTGYWSPYISVDMNSYLLTYPSWIAGAAANPNVGRPFIGGDYGGGDGSNSFKHNNYQLTAAYSLNFEDIMSKGPLASVLGHHEFTGLAGRYTKEQEDRSWLMYAIDPQTASLMPGVDKTVGGHNINWVTYLGDSLAGQSSATGINVSNIANVTTPMSGYVNVFNNTWTAGSGVDPTAPWTDPKPNGSVTMMQADNPANYTGYQGVPATILNSRDNRSELYTDGNKKEQQLTSKTLMYQGHFWDDTIVPSFGWRTDKVRQRGNQAPKDPSNLASMNYDITDPGVVINTTSTSYGVAVHLPKAVKQHLPEGMDLSVYYFHGSNQTPAVRYGIDGTQLPNEEGKTDDYSVQFDSKYLTLRVTSFKTVDDNATASYGQPLGAVGWMIDSLPAWTLTMAASGVAASELNDEQIQTPGGFQWQSWLWGWGRTNPALAKQIGDALKTDFVQMFPQSYWDQYGMSYVDVAAIKAGDWLHILNNGQDPFPWNIPNNHLIHGVFPTIDQSLVSKGYELEATLHPVHNLDITFNASKVSATQTALGADVIAYMNGMYHLWNDTVLGDTPEWGGGPIKNDFLHGLWGPYLTQVALTGSDQPELRKWHFNMIGNYSFDAGMLKGFNLGGAYRWDSKNIVGYGYKQVDVAGTPNWYTDVDKPLYGPSESHVDAWIGYQHKLTAKVDWKVQLNIRNVGEKTGLVPITYEPDGTVAQQRIQMGQAYDLSLKFMF